MSTAVRAQAATDPLSAGIARGVARLAELQGDDGSWRGDYGGPMFLLPMYVAARHITGQPIPASRRAEMIRYLRGVQNDDGSIGLHCEGRGMVFTSVLCYVALRLLGVDAADPQAARLRCWILANGGALGCASWGKFVLALLDLYDYDGLAPVTPELWLLPRAAPFHPGRLWCHCRQVYLPMAYLYGRRAKAPADALVRSLRTEIYDRPYESIRWRDQRQRVAATDEVIRGGWPLRIVQGATGLFEQLHPRWLRRRALRQLFDHICYEDRSTHFVRIGPVNAVLNTLVHFFADPRSAATRRSHETLDGYLWQAPDGVKMNGYNSTALWDTAFAVQAILAADCAHEHRSTLARAHRYIEQNQVVDELEQRERYSRHACRGGWPFSDRQHGWPITDCTAEGLKCALALRGWVEQPIAAPRLADSVRLILSFQNPGSGGWSTYELQRGGRWLERLNPSHVFADIMVDYPYVECSSACVQALAAARAAGVAPELSRTSERAIRRGERFIRRVQRRDGSWEGSWAVCFTYGTWFGVCGLRAAGARPADPAIARACDFLEQHQHHDGGWGEHFDSCVERRWIDAASHVVHTAWALLALVRGGRAGAAAARRAARFLLAAQQADGDWPAQPLVGVFNKTALINYEHYRRYFSCWALAAFARAGGSLG